MFRQDHMNYNDRKNPHSHQRWVDEAGESLTRHSIAPGKRSSTRSIQAQPVSRPSATRVPMLLRDADPAALLQRKEQAALTEKQWTNLFEWNTLHDAPIQGKNLPEEPQPDSSSLPASCTGQPLPTDVQGKMEGAFDADCQASPKSDLNSLYPGTNQRKPVKDPVVQRRIETKGYVSNIKNSEGGGEEHDKDKWVECSGMGHRMEEIYSQWKTNESNSSAASQLEHAPRDIGLYLINTSHKKTLFGNTNRGNYVYLVNTHRGAQRTIGDLLATLTHEVYLHLLPSLIESGVQMDNYQNPHESDEVLPEGEHAPILFPESFKFIYLDKQLSVFRGFLAKQDVAKAYLVKIINEIKNHVIGFRRKGYVAFRYWSKVSSQGKKTLTRLEDAARLLDEDGNKYVMELLTKLRSEYAKAPEIKVEIMGGKSLYGLGESPF